jgi:hypothetical protein
LEGQGVGGKMGSEWILGRLPWRVWTGFDWLRTGTGGRLLSAVMNLRVLVPRELVSLVKFINTAYNLPVPV